MRAGDVVGDRFDLRAKAGTGGMGTVWRALDRRTDLPVALKVLRDPDEGDVARFLHEAELLSMLEHRHIVRYIGHGITAEGMPYLAMEWLEGHDLGQRLANGGLTVAEASELVKLVAGALGAAHARGVVHRDIKPSNLFLADGEIARVKVLDFGIARLSGATKNFTQTGALIGTLGYMAPEQARSERRIGAHADVFSLGCVLFECLTGRPAFQGAHAMALLAKLLLEDPPYVCELRPDVPPALADLVAEMLAKDPAARPANGTAVERAMADLSDAPEAAPPGRTRHAGTLTSTEKRLVSIVAVAPVIGEARRDATLMASPGGLPASLLHEVEQAVRPMGARIEVLANRMVIAMLAGAGSPTDQTTAAARCALHLRALLPGSPIALITGRSETTRRIPVGELLEKAVAFVEHAHAPAALGVRLDDVSRALLDTRFQVAEVGGSAVLSSERSIGDEARTLLGKPSPFVGRERELRSLRDQIEEALEERSAQAILITAPAGMGKSRLRYELVRLVTESHPEIGVGVGRGDSLAVGSAFAMLGGAFRNGLGIAAGEPIELQRSKVSAATQLVMGGHAPQHVAEFLGELIGTPFPDGESPRLKAARQNPQIMAEQIRTAYIDFMRSLVRARPSLLLLEDLHWGDEPSVKLVGEALRELRDLSFVVVAFARPEVHDRFPRLWLGREPSVTRLGKISRRAAEQLVYSALGDSVDAHQMAAIVDRSEGNAFYLEELIRALAERRGESLPDTILGMVEARLAAVPVQGRRLLRAASVFGEAFWTSGLRAMLGADAALVDDTLAELVADELVTRRSSGRFAGEEEHGFRHALVREGAYAMLTEQDRALGHKLAGEWLARVGEQDPVILAEHFEQGGEKARAVRYHALAAQRAGQAGDFAAMLAAADRGLAAGPEDPVAAELWEARAYAQGSLGAPERAIVAAEEAMRLAGPASSISCRAIGHALGSALLLGRPDTIAGVMGRLLVAEPAPGGLGALAYAFMHAVNLLIFAGYRDPSEMYLNRLRGILTVPEAEEPAAFGNLNMALATRQRWLERDPWAALLFDRAAVRLLDGVADPLASIVMANAALDCSLLGAFEEALAHVQAALDGSRPGSLGALLAGSHRARIYFEQRLYDQFFDAARAVLGSEGGPRDRIITPALRLTLAEAQVMKGDLEAAEETLRAAVTGSAPLFHTDKVARRIQAMLLLARGLAAEAAEETEETIALCRAAGVYDLHFASLLLTRAEACFAAGDEGAAKAAIREARDDLSMRAARIGDPAYRQSFLERSPVHARTLGLAREWLRDEA
jgi:tetratricopeptide (TPR) repeat protein